jgi:hypothetical protein
MATLDELKKKYQSVVDFGKEQGVHWQNVHLEEGKLLLRGEAPNQEIKNGVWDKVKAVDAKWAADLKADIAINASLPVPARTYKVAAGDTLS